MGSYTPEFDVQGNWELAPERKGFPNFSRQWLLRSPFNLALCYDLYPRGGWNMTPRRRLLPYMLLLQLCPTLCDPMDCSPPGSSVSWGFSRQEHWSGLPCPPPGIFPAQESNPGLVCLLHWQAGSIPLAPPEKPLIPLDSRYYSWGGLYPQICCYHRGIP